VTLNGLEIGRVTQIVINESTGKLLVELQIKSNFPISKSSVAAFTSLVLLGKQISIEPNFKDKSIAIEEIR
jgi:phospholipid/cholesterol/gamma-HCH transport system substrate-binding protein